MRERGWGWERDCGRERERGRETGAERERERESGGEREKERERIAYKLYIILYTERLATMMIYYMFIFDKCGVIGFRV